MPTRACDREGLVLRSRFAGEQLGRPSHQRPVTVGVALQQRHPPPLLQLAEELAEVEALARHSKGALVGGVERRRTTERSRASA